MTNFNFTGTPASAPTNGYCSLSDMKAPDVLADTTAINDTALTRIINAVSRRIDEKCHRFFYQVALTQRFYQGFEYRTLYVDDIFTASGVIVQIDVNGDGVVDFTFSASDYILAPYNALAKNWPFTSIETTPVGNYRWPIMVRKGCWITAQWGWPAIPDAVSQACILWSAREYKREKAVLGISGMSALGTQTMKIPGPDHDIFELLEPYMHLQDVYG